jgi:hypothetical protein
MRGVLLNEVAKFVSAPRHWLPIILAAFFLGLINTDQIRAIAFNQQVSVNLWDAILVSMNNWIDLSFVLFMALAFSVSDIVTSDYLTNYHWLVLTRSRSRFKWWAAKLAVVFLVVLVAIVATLSSTLIWGLVQGIPFSSMPSSFAMGDFDGPPYFPVLAPDTHMPILVISMALLAALGLGAKVSCVVFLSLFLAKPFALIGLVFSWALLDYTLAGWVSFWQRYLSPTMKMMLMTHWPREDRFLPHLMPPLWTSVVFFVVIISAVCFFGWRRVRSADF